MKLCVLIEILFFLLFSSMWQIFNGGGGGGIRERTCNCKINDDGMFHLLNVFGLWWGHVCQLVDVLRPPSDNSCVVFQGDASWQHSLLQVLAAAHFGCLTTVLKFLLCSLFPSKKLLPSFRPAVAKLAVEHVKKVLVLEDDVRFLSSPTKFYWSSSTGHCAGQFLGRWWMVYVHFWSSFVMFQVCRKRGPPSVCYWTSFCAKATAKQVRNPCWSGDFICCTVTRDLVLAAEGQDGLCCSCVLGFSYWRAFPRFNVNPEWQLATPCRVVQRAFHDLIQFLCCYVVSLPALPCLLRDVHCCLVIGTLLESICSF